ncbi:MAG TPA: Mur ligase family protein, partial [Candidatus Saccharimonadales bacterium]|nr:Mur ligase family protein [Candidatus Saccharimonadales bacterium]
MTYAEALEYLASIEGLGIKLALRNITQVLSALGDPQRAFTSVLVAGTNGKGSVAAILESILRHAGHRTGLYTSPHLIRHEERVQIGGRPVRPETLAEAVGKVKEAIDGLLRSGRLEAHPTHFETFTAAAFVILAGAGVRTAVLEVGMGGRLDATVLAEPAFSILTNVSLEHTQYLGTTIGAIAREKAGVLRTGGTLLSGERHPDAVAAFRARASETGGHLVDLDDFAEVTPHEDDAAGSFDVRTRHRRHRNLTCALRGSFQYRNALTAVAAADLLA